MAVAIASGLRKEIAGTPLFDNVSFKVERRDRLALAGPNGAGKTTLFECVAGVLPADRGTVSADGRTLGPRDRVSHLFYVPDGIAPWPSQTLEWALEFTVGFFGGSAARVPAVIDQFHLEPLLGSRIGTLSKGQRKRALLALGLLTPQPLLLADEPFDGLDLRQTREVGAALRAHAAGGRTLFLSIHQIGDAARVCDRFVLLSGGRVGGEGRYEELADKARRVTNERPASLEEVVLALT